MSLMPLAFSCQAIRSTPIRAHWPSSTSRRLPRSSTQPKGAQQRWLSQGCYVAGARAYYAMARDGLFFRASGQLNAAKVPAWGLVFQGIWAVFLVLPRTYDPATRAYGNLYSNLLEYVISAALIFYILTIAGIFRLRGTRPDADRPYKAFGYPLIPALYILGAALILLVLFVYRPATTWPGLVIVLLGVPVYFAWKPKA